MTGQRHRGRDAGGRRRPGVEESATNRGGVVAALALVLLNVTCVAAAVQAEAATAPEPVGGPGAVTPVLSPRRVPSLIAAPVADRRLQQALDGLVARTPGTSCLVVNAGGRRVFTHNPDVALVPASLQKLVTATAALEVLGPDATYRTVVAAATEPDDGVVRGELYLVGGGDPLLMTDAYEASFERQPQIRTDLEALADQVVDAGVREVQGSVVGDESRYDRIRYVDGWPPRFIEQDQTGPLSALAVNDNFVAFPPVFDAAVPDEEAAPEPAVHAAAVLTDLLRARGVVVAGSPAAGGAPSDAVELAGVESPPLRDVATQMLRESDNMTAELVLKELGVRLGAGGSTPTGAAAVSAEIAGMPELAPGQARTVVADGSGLSDGNRQSCGSLQNLLDRAGPGSELGQGLAVAGQSGTLAERFLDPPLTGRLRAKTGTLNQVAALAGFLETVPGASVSFTYIVNLTGDDRVGEAELALQTDLALALAVYPQGPALAELGPQGPVPAPPPPPPPQPPG